MFHLREGFSILIRKIWWSHGRKGIHNNLDKKRKWVLRGNKFIMQRIMCSAKEWDMEAGQVMEPRMIKNSNIYTGTCIDNPCNYTPIYVPCFWIDYIEFCVLHGKTWYISKKWYNLQYSIWIKMLIANYLF